ncbi:PAS domain S-box protein [Sediminitomix flava]|uniref:PAS domain S-box-containing protein n=1 Tax=Sediminitomix flava TaxID=379075 RepID=A0A315Z701_SEDFL|nr:PAS domain S-box protein [Sediminitomix flava]PWJ40218.1 PAS domain S-box-containing protein [Sediminitomix flava]
MFLDKIKKYLESYHNLSSNEIDELENLIEKSKKINRQIEENAFFREIFRLVFKYTQESLFVIDFTGKFIYAPSLWLRLSGFSSKDLTSKNVSDYVHTEDLMIIENLLDQIRKDFKTIKDIQIRLKTKSGEYHWHNVNCIPSKKIKQFDNVILVTARDITEDIAKEEQLINAQENEELLDKSLKESREELHIYQEQLQAQENQERFIRKENAKNKAILNSIMNACDTQIFSVNTNFQLISCNYHFAESVEQYLEKKALYKTSIFEITTKNNRKDLRESLSRAFKGEEFSEFYSIEYANKVFRRKVLFTPIRNVDEVIGATVIAIDVSDL